MPGKVLRLGHFEKGKSPKKAALDGTLECYITVLHDEAMSEARQAESEILRGDGLPTLIAESAVMKPVLDVIAQVGPSDANVLITGEHGTGKEVVAQTLHQISPRAGNAMISVNVGGLAEGVFESEIFGHTKGAFTGAASDRIGRFELAHQGTLFLDEIANITPDRQARLLRVLETGEVERVGSSKTRKVDVRVLSATNADLSRDGLLRLGLSDVDPKTVQKLDSIEAIEDLRRIGRAQAREVHVPDFDPELSR